MVQAMVNVFIDVKVEKGRAHLLSGMRPAPKANMSTRISTSLHELPNFLDLIL